MHKNKQGNQKQFSSANQSSSWDKWFGEFEYFGYSGQNVCVKSQMCCNATISGSSHMTMPAKHGNIKWQNCYIQESQEFGSALRTTWAWNRRVGTHMMMHVQLLIIKNKVLKTRQGLSPVRPKWLIGKAPKHGSIPRLHSSLVFYNSHCVTSYDDWEHWA